MKIFGLFFSIACLMSVVGCSGNAGQTIEGKVTFTDGSPLGVGAVILSNGKNSYSGAIGSDGTYKMDNVITGDYKVAISGATVGGTASSSSSEGAYDPNGYAPDGSYVAPEAAQPAVSLVHESMNNPATSGLTLKVPGSYDIKVEKP